MITAGQKLPEFSLPNQDGKTKTQKDYEGKWLVLYVYPKDDTPGCTIQGQSFTATKAEFERLGVNIVGLSADDVKSHKDFCNKYSFTIDLLADPKATLLTALGVKQSESKGAMYWKRTTFLINDTGTLKKVYENVDPKEHEKLLLNDIQEMKQTAQ